MTQTRRLAAILAVDGGYSRLMEADGEGTHPGMGEIILERRATSNRNGGRHHRGFASDFPRNPQAREGHDAAIGERDRVRLFPGYGLGPLIKVVGRHQTAAALERFAEGRLALDPFGLGEADPDVLGPVGD
jgi:hypothetical protein